MGSIKNISSVNFSFTITNVTSDNDLSVTVKPLTDAGKKLFRHKKLGRETSETLDNASIFPTIEEYEAKAAALAAI